MRPAARWRATQSLDAQLAQALPLGGARDVVDQVVVDAVRAQAAELLVEDAVEVRCGADGAVRQLGGDKDAVAQAQIGEHGAHAGLVARVEVGGVQVVDAALDGAGDDGAGLLRVGTARRAGKAHAPEGRARRCGPRCAG